ncbi:VOC family protein [Gracilibacillus sp. D59]|uniref:VOC family protein n=1 Tax=Gracilibacillus sp. D59 TaxID=3457434 RepID=UPI003FCCE487
MSEQGQKSFVERIDAVFLPVKNLKESLVWYQEIFGFKLQYKNKRMGGLAVAPIVDFTLSKFQFFSTY